MSEYIHKSHNISVLLYHLVCPAKYRRAILEEEVDEVLREVCIEIGVDKDHMHFLVQPVPMYSVTKLVKMLKSLATRKVFRRCPHVKKQLWGEEVWSDGYFTRTVGEHRDEGMIARDVKNQKRLGC